MANTATTLAEAAIQAPSGKFVWEKCPLHEVILDMVIKHLPNPKEAQAYRIPRIWKGDLESPLGKSLLTCDPNGKLAFCITRILIEPKSGREVSAGRLYSGTIREGLSVYLNNAKRASEGFYCFYVSGNQA